MERKEKLRSFLAALFVGFIFDRVLYAGLQGLGLTIFTLCFVALFFIMLGDKLKLKNNKRLLLLIPLVIIAFRSSIYNSKPIYYLNFIALPTMVLGTLLAIWYEEAEYYKPKFISLMFNHVFIHSFANLSSPFKIIRDRFFAKEKIKFKIKPQVLTGIIISIPLAIVILVFLSSADQIFDYYIVEFVNSINIFNNDNFITVLSHLFVIFASFIYFFIFYWGISDQKELATNLNTDSKIDPLTLSIPVTALNVIYLFFSIIQFSYLYGDGTLPAGVSYSEYARRGFFELVAVTVINLSLIIFGLKHTKPCSEKLKSYCRILYTLLGLFTLNMLYSAHYKMSLYEESYGFTYLRVYVHLFMVLLLILILFSLVNIWYNKINLPKTILIASIVFYTFLNVINVDVFIAKRNIDLYYKNNKIDIGYLTDLSIDAWPYIEEFIEKNPELASEGVKNYVRNKRSNIKRKDSDYGDDFITRFLQLNLNKIRK